MGGNSDNTAGSWRRVLHALLPGMATPALAGAALGAVFFLATCATQPSLPPTSVDADGRYRLATPARRMFDRASLAGRPYIVYFGCTGCDTSTPAVLTRLIRLRRDLGVDASKLPIVLITLDPKRDTPERLQAFAELRGGNLIALTGSPEVIARVADSAGVFFRHRDGRVEHTTRAYIYDRNDEFAGTIGLDESDAAALAKLRAIHDSPRATTLAVAPQAGR